VVLLLDVIEVEGEAGSAEDDRCGRDELVELLVDRDPDAVRRRLGSPVGEEDRTVARSDTRTCCCRCVRVVEERHLETRRLDERELLDQLDVVGSELEDRAGFRKAAAVILQ
jgi:hypothetical protein